MSSNVHRNDEKKYLIYLNRNKEGMVCEAIARVLLGKKAEFRYESLNLGKFKEERSYKDYELVFSLDKNIHMLDLEEFFLDYESWKKDECRNLVFVCSSSAYDIFASDEKRIWLGQKFFSNKGNLFEEFLAALEATIKCDLSRSISPEVKSKLNALIDHMNDPLVYHNNTNGEFLQWYNNLVTVMNYNRAVALMIRLLELPVEFYDINTTTFLYLMENTEENFRRYKELETKNNLFIVEEAEEMYDADEPNSHSWLNGTESEEQFWEHT